MAGYARAIRVFVVEDDARVREAVAGVIARATELTLAGTASSLNEAREHLLPSGDCDVALIDLGLGDGSGVDVIRELSAQHPAVASVAFTVFADRATVLRTITAGARGYLLKDASVESLRARLVEAATGRAPLSPEAARFLVDALARQRGAAFCSLTARERDVANHLAEGATYAKVAEALGLSLATVQTHVKSIYGKLGVHTKSELVALAHRGGDR